MEFVIGHKTVGDNQRVFIIAEIGSNHNGDINAAKRMIRLAAEAGADAAKFQFFDADSLYSRNTPEFSAMKGVNVHNLIKEIQTPSNWIPDLAEQCHSSGIEFLATPFDKNFVDLLDPWVSAHKVASFELGDLELLQRIATKNKPILLSTGMASLGEIEKAIGRINGAGNKEIILLHCNSLYPTPSDLVNLRSIVTMRHAFGLPVGFSDHTMGVHIPVAAVALGAVAIEKHMTLDRSQPGPDHNFALEPNDLKQMISSIREVELALGSPRKFRTEAENEVYLKGRRSIHAATDIPKGSVITKEMLIVKRPAYGISPEMIDIVIGREARKAIKKDEWVTWDMI
ncbi:MAG: N-acetylneuraminate synthase family protein [Candidatus Bathyarchaeota archaeon]|nr:N-acetylneuraminate synthase family protein [Candidatus Bathyarchaeota archaeon]